MGLNIIAGDFKNREFVTLAKKGLSVPRNNRLAVKTVLKTALTMNAYEVVKIESLEILAQTEKESNSSNSGTSCLALCLYPIMGPISLLLAILAGVNKNSKSQEITFFCKLVDGRSFKAVCDADTYQQFVTVFHRNQ